MFQDSISWRKRSCFDLNIHIYFFEFSSLHRNHSYFTLDSDFDGVLIYWKVYPQSYKYDSMISILPPLQEIDHVSQQCAEMGNCEKCWPYFDPIFRIDSVWYFARRSLPLWWRLLGEICCSILCVFYLRIASVQNYQKIILIWNFHLFSLLVLLLPVVKIGAMMRLIN